MSYGLCSREKAAAKDVGLARGRLDDITPTVPAEPVETHPQCPRQTGVRPKEGIQIADLDVGLCYLRVPAHEFRNRWEKIAFDSD